MEVNPAPTLGLSGVVMGMMGLFVYFLPKTKIKMIFFIIVFFKRFMVPAWILVGIYFGLDVYTLLDSGMGGVNLIAHISGAAIGFFMGYFLFKSKKQFLKEQQ